MAIEWLAGNRLRGTTAERPSASLQSVGGWKEVGRTTLASNGDSLDVSSLTNKRYYMVLLDHQANGSSQPNGRFNSDSGSNYCYRYDNDGSDGTGTSNSNMKTSNGWNTSEYGVWYISNLAGKQKASFYQCSTDRGSGAGTAPSRSSTGNKWSNTSDAISSINFTQGGGGGNFKAGSECVVLGYDPADSHTTNFWEELSSVTTTSSGTISSGTITAKKYLMYNIIGKKASGTGTESARFRFNGDTGSNYAQRNAINGTHYTYGSQSSANIGGDGNTAGEMTMYTGFIINNASTEKLWLGFSAFGNSTGNNIGNKGKIFDKWANTSDQITSIECMGTTFDAGAKMTIWGSD